MRGNKVYPRCSYIVSNYIDEYLNFLGFWDRNKFYVWTLLKLLFYLILRMYVYFFQVCVLTTVPEARLGAGGSPDRGRT
jgi:uncharacterized membrane protein YhaH (DUF805 family)